MNQYMIDRLAKKNGTKLPAVKEKKPIAKISKKAKQNNKNLKKIVNDLKLVSPYCELRSPVCTGVIQGSDHTQKRSPKNLLDKANIKGSCNACNLYKESNPGWAEENGHSVSRFKKKAS
jgi:hypothetical protein